MSRVQRATKQLHFHLDRRKRVAAMVNRLSRACVLTFVRVCVCVCVHMYAHTVFVCMCMCVRACVFVPFVSVCASPEIHL